MNTPDEIQKILAAAESSQQAENAEGSTTDVRTELADPDEVPPYTAQPAVSGFEVLNTAGDVVVTCANAQIAEQYIGLLTQAFRRGYKAGFRIGKGRRPVKG